MKKLFLPLIALSAVAVATSNAQTIISDTFPSNFNNFTAQTAGGGSDGFQWSSTAGVGGVAGRIDAITGPQNNTDAVFYSGTGFAITWAANQEYAVSTLFTGTFGTGNINEVTTGALRSTGSNFFSGGGSGVWGQMRQDSTGNPFLRLYQQNNLVGSPSASFTLTSGNWYELETRFSLTNATTAATLGVYLYDRGTDGTDARTLVESISATNVTITNSGFSGADLFAGFGGGNDSGSPIAAFDNFAVTAIPEPSSFAALAGVLALGLVALRRRR
jgi:hypothetical protein